MSKDVIITGFSNPTSEGVTIHLNKKARLNSGALYSDEFWVSWDKIGRALFHNYTDLDEVPDRYNLRNQ